MPEFRRRAGICVIALLIGMFVANVNAAQKGVTLRGKPQRRFGCGHRCRFLRLDSLVGNPTLNIRVSRRLSCSAVCIPFIDLISNTR